MAQLSVNVVQIESIKLHPNADKLDIIKLVDMGYQVITSRDNFKVGDLAVYFPVDSVIPDIWVQAFGISNYYTNRLKAAKLRGIFSEGLIIPIKSFYNSDNYGFYLGDDWAVFFGVTKYQPPLKLGQGKNGHSIGMHKFPAPEHLKKYMDVFQEGEEIAITEKIHGGNYVIVNEDGNIKIASHNFFWDDIPENQKVPQIVCYKLYPELSKIPVGFTVYGEVYGKGIQDLTYGLTTIKYALFAASKDGKILDFQDFLDFCQQYELLCVPTLYRGEFNYDMIVQYYNNVDSYVSDIPQMMEGVSIVPLKERVDPRFGRVCMKYISDRYLLRKNGTENK